MQLHEQVAVVTGGASGLGLYIALAIAARGAEVVIGDLDVAAGRMAIESIRNAGGRAMFVRADVKDDDDLRHLVDTAIEVGSLRALVNNAGGWSTSGHCYPEAAVEDWSSVLALNLRAPMLATQLCLTPMAENGGGAVVNVSSSAALGPDSYACPEYSAAKAGLIRFTSSLADLAMTKGVRVSCLVPHWIGLPRAHREFEALSDEKRKEAIGLVPPEQLAAQVVRLLEDDHSEGRIVALRPRHDPYLLSPASIDPMWS